MPTFGRAPSPTERMPDPASNGRSKAARLALSLALAWIVVGALFKLLLGTPADLPPVVRGFLAAQLELGLKFRLAIGIELAIAVIALLRPRWGWPLVVLQYGVFLLVLAFSLGEESCGCLGSKVKLPPALMLAIDAALLGAVLATRPWRGLAGPRAPLGVVALAAAGAMALPWLFDRELKPAPNGDQGTQTSESGFVVFDLARWKGKLLFDTPLAAYVDPNALPPSALIVLWRWTCEHCAHHLERLANTETGERMLVLVRLSERGDNEANRAVFVLPSGPFVQSVTLPDSIEYVITTPGELVIEDYVVVSGAEGVDREDE